MLGYTSATSTPRNAFFGQGTGEIILDELVCEGTESNLSHCGHSGHGNHDCGHNEDASVICSTGTEIISIFTPFLMTITLFQYFKKQIVYSI